jgi:acyl-coenzyme A synthetase/AMP-(fatty) acid ligase
MALILQEVCLQRSSYNGKVHRHIPKLSVLLSGLSEKSITPLKVIIMHSIPQMEDRTDWFPDWISWDSFLDEGNKSRAGGTHSGDVPWRRMTFDAPLWILFSSGTTGKPKCVWISMCLHLTETFRCFSQADSPPSWWDVIAIEERICDMRGSAAK